MNIKELYGIDIRGDIHPDYNKMYKLDRDILIEIRNKVSSLFELRKIIEQNNLWEFIEHLQVRKDLEHIWINPSLFREFIDALNSVIIKKHPRWREK